MKLLKLCMLSLVLSMLFSKIDAQNCSTPDLTDIPNYNINFVRSSNQISYVAINLVTVKDMNNNYPTYSLDIDDEIKYANERYLAAGLQFYLCKVTEINSNLYNFSRDPEINFNTLLNTLDAMGEKSSVINQINLYHVNSILQGNGGVSRFPWNPYNNIIVMSGSDISYSTLCHELGHYFGLLHTHNGSAPGTILMPLVSQPKTTIIGNQHIGDGIEDTPSDPSKCYTLFDCNVVHCDVQKFDSAHIAYDTIVNNDNVMSYRCQRTFTPHQLIVLSQYAEGARNAVVSPQNNPKCGVLGNVHKICGDVINGFNNIPINNAKIEITKSPSNTSCSKRTYSNGDYNLANCVQFGTIDTIRNAPSKFIAGEQLYDYMNGVSTADLVFMNRHILGIESLGNPYYWLAADVNYDGKISTADMVKTRKMILFIDNMFENTNSWRFVPDWYQLQPSFSATFNDIANGNLSGPFKAKWTSPNNVVKSYPLANAADTSYMDRFKIATNMPDANNDTIWSFTAVKTGDVNCSSKVEQGFTSDDENLTLAVAPHLCIPAGDTATFDLIATVNDNMVAYQTQLDFVPPANALALPGEGSPFEVFNISAGQLSNTPTEFYNLLTNNNRKHLKVSWMNEAMNATNLTNGVSILQFSIKANQQICNMGSILSNVSGELNTQLYKTTGQLLKTTQLQLVKNNINARSNEFNQSNGIQFSVYPNPFDQLLNFTINIDQDEPIEINLINSVGQTVKSHRQQGTKGINAISIDTKGIEEKILFYKIKVGDKSFVNKVIKMEK